MKSFKFYGRFPIQI